MQILYIFLNQFQIYPIYLVGEYIFIFIFFFQEGILPILLRLRKCPDASVAAAAREALALVGYVDPVKGRGIRILTVDGGGTK